MNSIMLLTIVLQEDSRAPLPTVNNPAIGYYVVTGPIKKLCYSTDYIGPVKGYNLNNFAAQGFLTADGIGTINESGDFKYGGGRVLQNSTTIKLNNMRGVREFLNDYNITLQGQQVFIDELYTLNNDPHAERTPLPLYCGVVSGESWDETTVQLSVVPETLANKRAQLIKDKTSVVFGECGRALYKTVELPKYVTNGNLSIDTPPDGFLEGEEYRFSEDSWLPVSYAERGVNDSGEKYMRYTLLYQSKPYRVLEGLLSEYLVEFARHFNETIGFPVINEDPTFNPLTPLHYRFIFDKDVWAFLIPDTNDSVYLRVNSIRLNYTTGTIEVQTYPGWWVPDDDSEGIRMLIGRIAFIADTWPTKSGETNDSIAANNGKIYTINTEGALSPINIPMYQALIHESYKVSPFVLELFHRGGISGDATLIKDYLARDIQYRRIIRESPVEWPESSDDYIKSRSDTRIGKKILRWIVPSISVGGRKLYPGMLRNSPKIPNGDGYQYIWKDNNIENVAPVAYVTPVGIKDAFNELIPLQMWSLKMGEGIESTPNGGQVLITVRGSPRVIFAMMCIAPMPPDDTYERAYLTMNAFSAGSPQRTFAVVNQHRMSYDDLDMPAFIDLDIAVFIDNYLAPYASKSKLIEAVSVPPQQIAGGNYTIDSVVARNPSSSLSFGPTDVPDYGDNKIVGIEAFSFPVPQKNGPPPIYSISL